MILLLLNIFLSPWTKVEESFNVQAVHDLIFTKNLTEWDHFSFPGVVPRTFTGPVLLTALGLPIYFILGLINASKVTYLIATRIILSLLTWFSSYGFYSKEYFLLESSSFHMNFWGSRTLPNTFANVFTNLAFQFHMRTGSRNGLISLALYVFTAVVFRAEVAVLGGLMIISNLYYKRYTVRQAVEVFTLTFLSSLIWTITIDSYLWQKPFYWPELHVFIFNTWYNGSRSYGISPWSTYFLKMLPKIAPLAYPLSILAFFSQDARHKRITGPIFLYVFLYSFLPHKEWRFIMYAITPLQTSAAIYIASLSRWPKQIVKLLAGILFILSIAAMGISSLNYPGGVALLKVPQVESVYIDTFTAMNGASRFGQKFPCRPWIFSQNCQFYIEKESFTNVHDLKTCLVSPDHKSGRLCALHQNYINELSALNKSSQTCSKLEKRSFIPIYDKNETQTDFSSYTYILTHQPQRFPDRKVYDVVYGYDGLGYPNGMSLYQGLQKDFMSTVNLSWYKIIGPIRLVPKVWIME